MAQATENFLGICLGGKKCRERKKLRQENRKDRKKNRIARRNIRTEKLAAKKDSLVLDNQAALSTNQLLQQLTNPQEQVQAQTREIAQQNVLPPVPQNPQKKDNTLLWVGGGLGTLIILGLITFLLLKKK